MARYRILSLDGGGTNSLISILWLYQLQSRLRQPLHTYFDLIAGISSGSIIACQISAGIDIQVILERWLKDSPQFFAQRYGKGLSFIPRPGQPIYSDSGMNTVLKAKYGDLRFGGLLKTPTIIVSYDIQHQQVVVFNNTNPDHAELPVWQICRASAALPFCFPAYPLSVGGQQGMYIDGAVVGKNPAVTAIAAALSHHRNSFPQADKGLSPDQILLTSVGATRTAKLAMPSLMKLKRLSGLFSCDLLHAAIEGTPELNHLVAQDLLPAENYFRFQLECSEESYPIVSRLDGVSLEHCQKLAKLLRQYLETPEAQDLLDQLADRLEASREGTPEKPEVDLEQRHIRLSVPSKESRDGLTMAQLVQQSSGSLESLVTSLHPQSLSGSELAQDSCQGNLSKPNSSSPNRWLSPRLLRYGCTGVGLLVSLALFTQWPDNQWLSLATTGNLGVENLQTGSEDLLTVETVTAQWQEGYTVRRKYTGQLNGQRTSELGFERSGKVVRLLVQPGDSVTAGAPLAYLNDDDLEAQLAEIQAQRAQAVAHLAELEAGSTHEALAAAEANWEGIRTRAVAAQDRYQRRQDLYTKGAISQEQLKEAESEFEALMAQQRQALNQLEELQAGSRPEQVQAQQAQVEQIDAARMQLEVEKRSGILTAPFSGTIAARWVDEGTVVSAGQALLRLVESGPLEAQVEVPVTMTPQLAVGSSQTVDIDGVPATAQVKAILPEADASTGQATVVLSVDGTQALPGQLVSLHLEQINDMEGYWLPSTALVNSVGGLWTAYILKPAEGERTFRLQPQTVEVLHSETDRVFVRGTLQPGDQVVSTGIHRLVPQQQVRLARSN
jgi:multidrug resistance efflux pump